MLIHVKVLKDSGYSLGSHNGCHLARSCALQSNYDFAPHSDKDQIS